uniref:Uncharacterized protein n=1 Tax=Plectus sambesii TaxID=2011161 RepID=A0A914XB03_9BILA
MQLKAHCRRAADALLGRRWQHRHLSFVSEGQFRLPCALLCSDGGGLLKRLYIIQGLFRAVNYDRTRKHTARAADKQMTATRSAARPVCVGGTRWTVTRPAGFCFYLLRHSPSFASLECNPSDAVKKPDPKDPSAYFYCSLEGVFARRHCVQGRQFNATTLECDSDHALFGEDDPFSNPLNQAPADLCGAGIPLTRLSAPVLCNPSISSCPDGYVCTLYAATGSSYCCQNPTTVTTSGLCTGNQVTYISPTTGQPLSCVLGQPSTCPTGFGCNVVSGTVTRCCGSNFGCPYNSAAFLNPATGSYVICVLGQANACQNGFVCAQSVSLNTPICCSATSNTVSNLCPSGVSPLASPNPCSASVPCPASHTCTIVNNVGICCPSSAVCPAGAPLGGITVCSESNPCQTGYECVTTNGAQYCCRKADGVCGLQMNAGVTCAVSQTAQTKYYFDVTTGTCRTFQYSGCGGNDNRFDTLQQCESFCLAKQCSIGRAYRVGTSATNSACTTTTTTCPSQYTCQAPTFGPVNQICCPTPELVCNEAAASGTQCFTSTTSITRYSFNPSTRQCVEFQYLGCDGNSNNFATRVECSNFCLSAVNNVCSGAAPLLDPNNQFQLCSVAIPCPQGYSCTPSGAQSYCCPLATTSCTIGLSVGVACAGGVQRVLWYYNTATSTCQQFTYLGCGGNANRFLDQTVCTSFCASTGTTSGNCPTGMTPVIPSGQTTVQVCTLNVPGTCPAGSSCIRSTTNAAICCQGTLTCPNNRVAYIIPGSDSVVSCQPDVGNTCPANNECVVSANISGFYLCCSTTGTTTSTCPNSLLSNGLACTMNAVNGCAGGYLCLRAVGSTAATGICCQVAPVCSGGLIPSYISGSTNQVQVCQADLAGCPLGSTCTATNIPSVTICCQTGTTTTTQTRCVGNVQPYIPPGNTLPQECLVNTLNACPVSYGCQPALDGRYVCCPVQQSFSLCSSGVVPYYPPGSAVPQVCNIAVNTCPVGYSCQTSSTAGQYVCCPGANSLSASCPAGTNGYLLYTRGLSCPRGSTACPPGFYCTQSTVDGVYLCCGSGSSTAVTTLAVPNCANGATPLVAAGTNQRQYCSPTSANVCPNGFSCLASTITAQYICCSSGITAANPLLTDYCPVFQIPFIPPGATVPVLCHMTTNPCGLPYTCIFSSIRQNSYCCAPSSRSASSALDGCPIGSRPLFDGVSQVRQCDPMTGSTACPQGYLCQYSVPFLRWQCCTASTLRARKWPSPSIDSAVSRFSSLPSAPFSLEECPANTYKINSKCLPLYYPGQRGCTVTDQCALKVPETRCDAGYCMCPSHKLIHQGRCVGFCPDGYINAAARCNDIMNVVMMDAVDERQNGTIGGWCLDTVIRENQCTAEHSECSDRSLTCQCKHGYELDIQAVDEVQNIAIGACIPIADSKWHQAADEVEMSGDAPLYADLHDHDEVESTRNVFLQIADI